MCNCSHSDAKRGDEQDQPQPLPATLDSVAAEQPVETEEAARAFEELFVAPNAPPLDDEAKKNIEKRYLGKKLVEAADDSLTVNADTEFRVKDLPKFHRIFRSKNEPATMDYHPDRINIYLDKDGKCNEIIWV
ncbi:hypothetical protein LPJ61_005934 [Coemansia biformis]|uniref:Uncharacterized protein n=1 Tax=Coemansia biformis TaxID=1286918 RepID=A0A9W7Y1W9_9FUNG|nr:hypothetical protein LPJ61_005934 [Coemansia biformis]